MAQAIATAQARSRSVAYLGGLPAPTSSTYWVNVGTGTLTLAPTLTALSGEVATARLAATTRLAQTTVPNDTVVFTATYSAPSGGITLGCAGVFDAATAGNLLLAASFGPLTLQSGDTLTLTFSLAFT